MTQRSMRPMSAIHIDVEHHVREEETDMFPSPQRDVEHKLE